MQSSMRMQVLRYLPGTAGPALVALATAALFTRWLSASDYGKYAVAFSAGTLGAAIISQWVVQAMNRYLPGEPSGYTRRLYKGGSVIGVGLGMAFLAAGCGGTYFVAAYIGGSWAVFVLPVFIFASATALLAVLAGVIQSEMRAGRYSWYRVADSVLRLAFAVAWIVIFHGSAAGIIGAAGVALLPLLLPVWKDARVPSIRQLIDCADVYFATTRQMAKYGLPMTLWYVFALLLSVGDRFFIGAFRGSSEVGVYAANYALGAGAAALMSAPILLAAHPKLMSSWNSGNMTATAAELSRIVEGYCAIGVLAVALAVLLADEVARIFLGEQFHAGASLIPVVFAGVVVWQLGMYTQKPLEFAGRTRELAMFAVLAALLNAALNITLLPRFGYPAAAYATLLSYLAYAGATLVYGRRLLRWRVPWRRVLVWLCSTAVALMGARQIQPYLREHLGNSSGDVILAMSIAFLGGAAFALRNNQALRISQRLRRYWQREPGQ